MIKCNPVLLYHVLYLAHSRSINDLHCLHIGTPHFIEICFIVLPRYCFFFFLLQVEVMWQPCFEQVCQNYFPHIMCSLHFISLCHILVILIIFKNFSLLFYLLRLSVISDFFFFFWQLCWARDQTCIPVLQRCHRKLCDQSSFMLPFQKDYNLLKARMMVSIC